MNLQDELRETLRYAAADLSGVDRGPELSAEAMQRRRTRQVRQRTGFIAAGLAAVLVIIGVPLGLSWLDKGRPNTTPAEVPAADIFTQPTRGSLASDDAFVDGVRQLPWDEQDPAATGLVPVPAVDSRHVVFAGDVPGARWALVVGPEIAKSEEGEIVDPDTDPSATRGFAAAWFVGPAGASPDLMVQQSPPALGIAAESPSWRLDVVAGTLVVVAAPGDVVQVSEGPTIAAGGSISREFHTIQTSSDGIAVLEARPDPWSIETPIRVQVIRDGVELKVDEGQLWTIPASGAPAPPLTIEPVRAGVVVGYAQVVAGQVVGATGLDPSDLKLHALWTGGLPTPPEASAKAAVVAVTLPSGAVVIIGQWESDFVDAGSNVGAGGLCVEQVLPAGQQADQRVYAMRCDVKTGSYVEPVSALVVVGPPTVTAVRAVDAGGAVLGEWPAPDGIAVVAFPEGTVSVQPLTADSTTLAAVELGQVNYLVDY